MGLAKVNTIDGALYGFKGEIKEAIRDGRVPNWMHPNGPNVWAGENDPTTIDPRKQSPRKFLKRTKEYMKRRDGGRATFEVYGRKSNRNSRMYSPTDSKARPPERIREKLEDYLDGEHQNVLDWMREGEFYRGLRVVVEFGSRGGVKDLHVEAEYGN